jgi:tRNA modification GTPase
MPPDLDTIVAISTPPGRGGIGIVRLSGPRALEIAAPLLRLNHPLAPARARFCEILDLADPDLSDPGLSDPDLSDPALDTQSRPSNSPVILSEGASAPQSKDPRALNPAAIDRTFLPTHSSPPASSNRSEAPILDQAIATYFPAPHSYTGDHVLEIAAHGSPVLLDYLVRQCCARGARLAEPGEFTQRAFLAGRIDLTQAEAVHDLIASSTLEQARLAARQLSGSLALTIAPIKAQLVALIATLEAGIDFAEDDIDVLPADSITAQIAAIHAPLADLERTFATGRVVRDGFRLAIVGRPNAGKSSLFNRLVQRDRAIVTASPGTTRDLVTETVAIDGIPVHLVDTAGLRDSADEAERLGIAKSHQAMADADLVLLVLDAPTLAATPTLAAEDRAILARYAPEDHAAPSTLLLALNKIDLLPNPLQISKLLASLLPLQLQTSQTGSEPLGKPRLQPWPPQPSPENEEALAPGVPPLAPHPNPIPNAERTTDNGQPPHPSNLATIPTSALTGLGIPELRAAIVAAVAGPAAASRESALLTNLRQHQSVAESLRALAAAHSAVAARIPHEMLLLDLYAALRALDSLTGATTPDDVLRLIFSTFCIGK